MQPAEQSGSKQWHLCRIIAYPDHEGENLKSTDNLSVRYPHTFLSGLSGLIMGESAVKDNSKGEGDWFIWLPIIPRVGDTLQFSGWQVEVSRVILQVDWTSKTGVMEGLTVSAYIHIRDNAIPHLFDAFSVEEEVATGRHKWENYARRGHDLDYYSWELLHDAFKRERRGAREEETEVYHLSWHTRIRPMAGDYITVDGKRWKVKAVALASAIGPVDGWLSLEGH